MKKIVIFIIAMWAVIASAAMSEPEYTLNEAQKFVSISPDKSKYVFLKEPEEASFEPHKNGWVWISDIEHVIEKHTGEIFLADGENKIYMTADKIPAGKNFQLFPYHFYGEKEEKQLGKKINYALKIKNVSDKENKVDITAIGTTITWDHSKAWQDTFAGKGKKSFTLKPGEIYTLWEEKQLVGELPWSGLILGSATGELLAYDYCYTGEKDPDIEGAKQMPDLTYEPYLLASFTRGSAEINAADVNFFPKKRNADGKIKLSEVKDNPYSLAISYSPGGPVNKLCEYKEVEPSFKEDRLSVMDPVSKKEHLFFGGNYPIIYNYSIPLVNDTKDVKEVSFLLCSNDKFNVDSFIGVWIDEKMLNARIPGLVKDSHWQIFTLKLNPGDSFEKKFKIVSLGGRWGAMITTLQVKTAEKK